MVVLIVVFVLPVVLLVGIVVLLVPVVVVVSVGVVQVSEADTVVVARPLRTALDQLELPLDGLVRAHDEVREEALHLSLGPA